jgi:WD40 repeat protein
MMNSMKSRPFGLAFLAALLALPLAAETPENLYGAALPAGAILRIGQPAPSEPGMLGLMQPLPGGKRILVAGKDGMIRIFDLSTGVVLRKIGPQPGGFWREMSLSSDGKTLVSQPMDSPRTIFVWDLDSGKLLREIGRGEWISDVALSPDGSVLAWGNMKSPLKFIDVKSGAELPVPEGAGLGVVSLSISADGGRLVASGADQTARLFDLRAGKLIREFRLEALAHTGISPDGSRLVVSWTDQAHRVEIRDEAEGWKAVALTPACSYRTVISPEGRWLATGSAAIGGTEPIEVWDLETGVRVSTLNSSFACDPPVFVSAGALVMSGDGTKLRTWDVASGRELESTSAHTGRAYFVSWSEDGRSLLSAGADGCIRRWDAASGRELSRTATLGGVPYFSGYLPIASLAGNRLALSEDNSVVSIWSLDGDRKLKEFEVGDRSLRGMALSPDGKLLASESEGTLVIRDIGTGNVQQEFKEPIDERDDVHPFRMISQSFAAWSPDGRLVAWSDRRGNDHLCHCDSGEMTPISFQGRATCARFSPDSKRLLLGATWNRPAIVNVETGKCEPGQSWASVDATALAWSADGRQFAMGEAGGRVSICDSGTGEEVRHFQAAPYAIRAVAISPRGDRLASAGDDGAIIIWNLGEPAKPPAAPDFDGAWRDLRAPNGASASAAFSVFCNAGNAGTEDLARRLEADAAPAEAGRWIRQLDAEEPAMRASALESLADAGVLVEPALTIAAGSASAEAGAAIRELLARLDAPLMKSCGSLRRLRALQVFEVVRTPAAKAILARLAEKSASLVERTWAADCLHRLR